MSNNEMKELTAYESPKFRYFATYKGAILRQDKSTGEFETLTVHTKEDKSGRLRTFVTINGKEQQKGKFVIEAWLPREEGKTEVDHISKDTLDDSVPNLRWADRKMQNDNRECSLFETNEANNEHARIQTETYPLHKKIRDSRHNCNLRHGENASMAEWVRYDAGAILLCCIDFGYNLVVRKIETSVDRLGKVHTDIKSVLAKVKELAVSHNVPAEWVTPERIAKTFGYLNFTEPAQLELAL